MDKCVSIVIVCCWHPTDLGCSAEAAWLLAGAHHQQVAMLVALIIQRPGQADLPRLRTDAEKAAGIDQQAVTDELLLERNGVHHQEAEETKWWNQWVHGSLTLSYSQNLGFSVVKCHYYNISVLVRFHKKDFADFCVLVTACLWSPRAFPSPCGCLYLYKLNWWVVYHQQILHNYAYNYDASDCHRYQSVCTNIDNIEYCYCCIPEYSHDFSAQTHTHTHTSVTVTHIIDDYHCQIDIEELWWQTWTCVCVTCVTFTPDYVCESATHGCPSGVFSGMEMA